MMKTYTVEELNAILEKHREWIISKGEKGQRADLSDTDLRRTNLNGADLSKVNLRNAILSYANLRNAILGEADLTSADLSYANLKGANLSATNLYFCKIYNTKGDLITISNQGKCARSVTLNKNTKIAFIGCFSGSFEEARKRIFNKYKDRATSINDGYGLTIMAMEAIEKQHD